MAKDKKYRKKKLGSYPFASVVFSVTLALFVMGLFGLLILTTNNLTRLIQENVEIQVFLHKGLSQNEVVKITKILSSKDYVLKSGGQAQIQHITKEEAAETFMEETGEDFVNFLGDNPLRDVIKIKVSPEYQASQNLAEIKKEIGFISGVFEVTYIENLVQSINKNVRKISYVLVGFTVILLIVVVVLINNTIKLALFSQRFLIRSMQLVGATSSFIRKPFLSRASWFGLLSGMLACALIWGVLQLAEREIEGLIDLVRMDELLVLTAAMLLVGLLVGFISTFAAIKKYMKMSLDELY
ncbi:MULTISPECIES: cell division protein FtsX [Reichenbachiella]|uniref:Cell division protein FtsX n=1 Tax=Reichenbachiella agariperforans TaxID=156994 RepID=A0A1M6N5V8_REIAG|nr:MULTISPECIES: permease-like cell division protein FtsX [Reichenbachiella]MBU2915740.1 permease-like cell division protein FtsX [Reichenbachiella agariperforans]RJE71993.1 cell division protein [Reichenbachiella sp. MSK19-1]SHJ91054.1 cell division transport system permease protein [Reichenbachiella agariperforans]